MEMIISRVFSLFECRLISCSLTLLARALLGNVGTRSPLYGHRFTLSVLPRPLANVPQ